MAALFCARCSFLMVPMGVLVHFTAASSVCVHFCLFSIQSCYSVNCSFPSTKWYDTCTTTLILLISGSFGTIWGGGCNMHQWVLRKWWRCSKQWFFDPVESTVAVRTEQQLLWVTHQEDNSCDERHEPRDSRGTTQISMAGMGSTPCPGKNGPPKRNAVKCTVYNTIQWHLHSII